MAGNTTTEFPVIKFRDCSGGMISAVDDELMPDSASRLSLNFRHTTIGRATQRSGYTRVGASVSPSKACQGLGWYQNSSGTRNRLVGAFNGINYAYDGATWTAIGSGMDTTKVRYANFLDLIFRVGGGAITKSWNGDTTGSFGTSQVTDAPSGTLITVYKNVVYIAGNTSFPDRVYFSSAPSLSGDITWDTTTNWLDVNPSDSDNITGFAKTATILLVFKRDHCYRWNGTSTDAEPVINVGAVSQEVIANVKGSVFFFHPSGVYSTDGGTPVEVSRPIKNFIDAIPAANYASMCAYADTDRYGLFCGDVTVDGRTYTNLVLEYDTVLQAWQGHYLADGFRNFTNAKDSTGADYVAGGATDGDVHTMFSGTTDNGSAIPFERETRRVDFDGRHTMKDMSDFALFLSGAEGALFEAIVEDVKTVRIGTTTGQVTIASNAPVKGRWMSFRISGTNTKTAAEWRGFSILNGRSLGTYKR